MPNDIGSVLPATVNVRFFGKVCPNTDSSFVPPKYYISIVSLSQAGYPNLPGFGFNPNPPGINTNPVPQNVGHTIHDAAPALFIAPGDPTNKVELDALAVQLAKDYYAWRMQNFDLIYNGIAGVVSTGFHDIIEFNFGSLEYQDDSDNSGDREELRPLGEVSAGGDTFTRVTGTPWMGEPEEFAHVGSDCDGNVICGPPEVITATQTCLTKYRLMVFGGQLVFIPGGAGCCVQTCKG